jgi:hypothetical protein
VSGAYFLLTPLRLVADLGSAGSAAASLFPIPAKRFPISPGGSPSEQGAVYGSTVLISESWENYSQESKGSRRHRAERDGLNVLDIPCLKRMSKAAKRSKDLMLEVDGLRCEHAR